MDRSEILSVLDQPGARDPEAWESSEIRNSRHSPYSGTAHALRRLLDGGSDKSDL